MAEAFDNIRVFRIAQTRVNPEAIRAWLQDMGADEFLDEYMGGAYDEINDPAFLVALAAKQCYMAFQPSLNPNLTRVRKDLVEYLDNVLKQGHGSVLEHAVFTYAINGVSRVFTGENNRHKAGTAISERSMRYVRYDNISYWMPHCFRDAEGDSPSMAAKKAASRLQFQTQFESQEAAMRAFANIWKDELEGTNFHTKKVLTSAFRRIIGMGIATGGVWSGNLRSFRHMVALRTDPAAEEEIVDVYMKIGHDLMSQVPELFGDFQPGEKGGLVPLYPKV
jgi:thymidylate synthase (FAD)